MSARLSRLPFSWGRVKLRNLIQPRETTNPAKRADGTFQYVDIEALDNAKQLITSPKLLDVKAVPSRARIAIKKGDVIFSLVRPYLKNIAVVPDELDGEVASTAFCQLRPTTDIDNRFLFYQLIQDSFIHSIPTYGTSPPAARDEEFLELVVVVPPIKEQERAVSKIEELFSDLDAGIASLERARAKLKRYRASVLKAGVEGRLTEKWRAEQTAKGVAIEPAAKLLKRILAERRKKWEATQLKKFADAGKKARRGGQFKYLEATYAESDQLRVLPANWCRASIDQIAEVGSGTTPSKTESRYWVNGSIPWVTSSAVNESVVTVPSDFVTEDALKETTLRLCVKIR